LSSSNKPFLTSIFLTALIDMLGVGIIIPVIPAIFYAKSPLHFPGINSPDEIRWTYCLLIASFSFMLFFGAPILGTLSDKYGRKKVILISIIGQAFGYSLFGLSIKMQNLPLLFLSRMIPGFFAGNLSVLFSAISDISSTSDKAKNFGLIGMAFGLGFIFGPFLGGVLSDNTLCLWFDLTTPFILTVALTIINFILVYFKFQETSKFATDNPISLSKGFRNIKTAIKSDNLRVLFSISFLNTLGFTFFTQFFSVFMFQKFRVDNRIIGYIFLWVGLWLIFTQGYLVRKVFNNIPAEKILKWSMLSLGLSIILISIPNFIAGILACNFFIAISQGLNSPNLLSLVSKQAHSNQQGEILGINQSMQSLGQFIPPIIVGFFGEHLQSFPMIIGGGVICIAWLLFNLSYNASTASQTKIK
jgi:DHA1 family tetracycline resistance protein-like MFS transporter